uniref:G-protein coupled receptors family 1 profile domain-containing protein n=1 Tax=Anabas testudineus TaxID=64144 RepID=A0AAQ6IET9_ANATE
MDDKLNTTYLTFAGYMEVDKYRYLYFVVIFIVYIVIICSNSTIVYLIWIQNILHEPMYIFIAALLMNSILFSTNIYPKLLFYMFYSLGGSEFLLLAAMSYDRYVSICKPLQYPTIMSETTVSTFLVLAWLVPACQLGVATVLSANEKLCSYVLQGIYCNNIVYKLQCVISIDRTIRDIIIMVNVALLPLMFILFTYTRILVICYRSCREVRQKAAQTCLPHLIVLIIFSCLCIYDVILVQLESHFPKTVTKINWYLSKD